MALDIGRLESGLPSLFNDTAKRIMVMARSAGRQHMRGMILET
jgi:hypothetical protein